MAFKRRRDARRIFAIGNVDDKDQFGFGQIALSYLPLVIIERCAAVVRRDSELKPISLIDLTLGLAQWGKQAGTDVEDSNVHAVNKSGLY
jgi:hypothetical protein